MENADWAVTVFHQAADPKCQDGTEPRGEHSSLLTLQPKTLDEDITMDVYWNATMVSQQQFNLCKGVSVCVCVSVVWTGLISTTTGMKMRQNLFNDKG